MLTVNFVLIGAAFICAVASASGKPPTWVAVVLLTIWALLQVLPR